MQIVDDTLLHYSTRMPIVKSKCRGLSALTPLITPSYSNIIHLVLSLLSRAAETNESRARLKVLMNLSARALRCVGEFERD